VSFHASEQRHEYVAYGLRLTSNLPIAGLSPCSSIDSPDVQVKLGTLPESNSSNGGVKLRYSSPRSYQTGEPDVQIWDVHNGEFLRVLYRDGVEFWLDRHLKTLWAYWPTGSSLQDTVSYFVGPILGLLLRLRGIVCLHASSVSIIAQLTSLYGVLLFVLACVGQYVLAPSVVRRTSRLHCGKKHCSGSPVDSNWPLEPATTRALCPMWTAAGNENNKLLDI
jgi:hypothetical protein